MGKKKNISDSFREWLDQRHEPEALKSIAYSAIDSYESFKANSKPSNIAALDELFAATCHKNFVIWDVAMWLLFRLARKSKLARDYIRRLVHSKKHGLRQRSLLGLGPKHPRKFSCEICEQLIADRAQIVRWTAARKIEALDLQELLPLLELAVEREVDEQLCAEMELFVSLMRDGYHVETTDGFYLSIRVEPGHRVCFSYFEGKPLTKNRFRKLGIDYIREKTLEECPRLHRD